MNKEKLIIVQEYFTDYRKGIYDLLSEDYELMLIHTISKSTTLNTISADYSKVCKAFRFRNFIFIKCFKEIISFKPSVIIHQGSPGILSLPFVLLLCKINEIKFVIWTHGFERKQGFKPKASFRSRIRLIYYKLADAVIFYTKERKLYFEKYLPKEKLFYATNTLNSSVLEKHRFNLSLKGLDKIKKELMWDKKFNLVFIGRMLSEKLPDHLHQAYILLPPELKSKTALHFIGNGEMEKELKLKTARHENIIFHGPIYNEEITSKMLFAADLMIMPGYIGLSIVHSFLLHTPVITYEKGLEGPFHSPEIDYLENNKNGLFAETMNIADLSHKMLNLLREKEALNYLKKGAADTCIKLDIKYMKIGFDFCINHTLKSNE